jgi:hypothetical protein
MYQAINNVFRKAGTANSGGRSSLLRGRRKDDFIVAGIAVFLGVLFIVQ